MALQDSILADNTNSSLTNEQRALVDILAAQLDAGQARWVSAYFEGLSVGRVGAAQSASIQSTSVNSQTARTLTILFGSETGNAGELAKLLAERAGQAGLAPTVIDMADYKIRSLAGEQDLLIVVSTHGEGDPPQPAAGFFEFVEGRKAPKLDQLRFAVLALGDSSYEYFCEAGKRLDRRFEELGASRLADRIDCDIDYEEPFEEWRKSVLGLLHIENVSSSVSTTPVSGSGLNASALKHDKRNPFMATVIDNLPIVGRGSSKETRHIEVSLDGSGLNYEPGDALGVLTCNDSAVVTALLEALEFNAEHQLELKGETTTVKDAFAHRFEITTATPRFLEYWARVTKADELRTLLQEDRSADRAVYLHRHHIIDIVRRFSCRVTPEDFATSLRPLQPRLYSIASSLAAAPDEAHLTVAPVRYDLHDETRTGVCSGLLADRSEPETVLPVYIQTNTHFRLPDDEAPIIMIGAGTGVAPYRAFLQELEAAGKDNQSWLFFGERNFRTDFLYQAEWQGWLKDGTLTRMDVAFSRDGPEKIYVQHRMREQSRDVFDWLESGAHIYVCGDAVNLAPDVEEALIDLVALESRTSREAAEGYVRSLNADHRYHRDVY
ncbi:assimilatory sulfite reductase (NADPH) flavoprotein subunit [Hyphococcus luteus]|uniref:Sulfite reductase [NADPH] flavoprotein alpha-component n=1 Tax=Hyphococcus luteus TaxID=2058213 RepID=A0A2S7KAY7_9PROT|nr:assimilatory sulfite reductase (NADPH) flavoprotein subunit [Marinicaulis flavus]PQA89686.1 assimilatory sulfite reductase (NADPH) flavoprotein subunit [Marinicaulis flavus]